MTAGLAIQASPGSDPGTVRGVVRNAVDGRPLSNAIVTLLDDDRSTITDLDGIYAFYGVIPGERKLRASRLDFQPLEVTIDLPDSGRLKVDFLLSLRPVELPVMEARASPRIGVDSLS